MSKPPTSAPSVLSAIPEISARDADLSGIFPENFEKFYEVHSYRNAARILLESCKADFQEIINTLMKFRIPTVDVVVGGATNRESPSAWKKG